ncbi:MAG: imidazole glycerol phosphate synthase subunit HisH [Lachnospiraceae bacterium]|nr:imidazole glycerol phosphate synthase subunit HisH [Lachnospiraceae bacterium]
MIAIVDYDAGNLKSVEKALLHLGQDVVVTRNTDVILSADKVILPGVGSFGDAMHKLNKYNLTDTLKKVALSGTPFLGICLGLQLMFESSEESEGVEGLSILKGKVVRFPEVEDLKIPQIGWNSIKTNPKSRLFENIASDSYVYFVHSYYLKADNPEDVAATAEYGIQFDAAVEHENIFACQFHPEKSGEIGLAILNKFANL